MHFTFQVLTAGADHQASICGGQPDWHGHRGQAEGLSGPGRRPLLRRGAPLLLQAGPEPEASTKFLSVEKGGFAFDAVKYATMPERPVSSCLAHQCTCQLLNEGGLHDLCTAQIHDS